MTAVATHDIFISYAEADRAWVEGYLLNALTDAGVRYHSEAAFELGVPRVLAFEQAVTESQRTLIVLSPAYLADGFASFVDLLAQSYGLETATWPVVPLILDRSIVLPRRLAILKALDASDAERWSAAIQRLCAELRRPVPAAAQPPDCPYPGMMPFRSSDTRFFFGREQEIEQMIQHLRHQRSLFIIGPSGSGKSSLISAGLVPSLVRSRIFPRNYWRVRTLRPSSPTLQRAALARPADLKQAIDRLLLEAPPARRLLLVLDQFEELFTQVGRAEQSRFIRALKAVRAVDSCSLLVAMRADFYNDLMNSDLWPIDPSQRLELAPLRGEALHRAIEQPAENCGVYLEAELLERLIANAADEPGALPLIQETMVLLWSKMARRLIPLSAYEQLGSDGRSGLAVAIATKADATLAALSAEQQAIARRILLRLVQFGEGRADTRRQQPFEALRSAGDDVALFTQTLHHLADNRLLTLSSAEGRVGNAATTQTDNREPERRDTTPPTIRSSLVDIAHEALIAGWPTLHGWLTERREAEQIRRRLEDQAASWVRLGSTHGGLLDSVELLEAERWLESPQAVDLGCSEALPKLVQASRAAIEEAARAEEATRRREVEAAQALATAHERRIAVQARSARQLRWLVTILAVVALGALGAAWYALTQARIALSRQLAAQSIAMLDDQPDLALLLGLEAFNTADITAARYSLIAARERSPYLTTFLRGHKSDIKSVAFSPDGRLIATSGCGATDARRRCRQGIVNLWNATSHRLDGAPLTGHAGSVDGMAFSPDGRLIATAGCGALDANSACVSGEIRLWDVRARQVSATFPLVEQGGITSLAFSPSGMTLAAAGRDGTISLWELPPSTQSPTMLVGHAGIVSAISFSTDGQRLVSGGEDKTVRVWDIATHTAMAQLPTVHLKHVRSVAFSPDGSIFASSDLAGQIRLWDAHTLAALGDPLVIQGEQVWSLAFSPDGRLLASGGRSKRITLWQVATRQPIGPELIGHQDSVTSLAFSRDGKHLVSGSMDTTAILWNIGAQPPLFDPGGPVRSVLFSRDGSSLIAGSCGRAGEGGECNQGEIRRWDSATYTQIGAPIPAHNSTVTAMALSKDGRLLATGSADATIIVWNTLTWQPRGPPLTGHSRRIESLAFKPDGTLLASGSCSGSPLDACRQGEIRLWQVDQLSASGPPIRAHEDFVTSVAFSHDGAMLASGSLDRTVMLWNTSTRQQIDETLRGHTNRVYSVAFNQDSTILASGGADQDVILWDVAAHRQQGNPLTGHTDSVYSLAFRPDGSTLASAGADGAVLLWDIETQQRIGIPIRGHPASIFNIAFSGDGRRLATAGEDQTVIAWDVGFLGQDDVAKWRDIVCAIVARDLSDDEWKRFGSGARATGARCKAMEDER